ncbi:MAG: YceI family protein [Planctomycetes bacterium]|nr:YceI family protein [Planctomycetota bacterium]
MRLLASLIAPGFLALAGFAGASAADTYALDGAHTAALFKVSHMGFSYTWGRFNDVTGTVTWDDADLAKSAVKVVIKSASIDSGNAKKDEHLKGGDFFSVKEYPEITFVSKKIEKSGDSYHVTGDFTMHGVTKSVTIPVVKMKEDKDFAGKDKRIGFDTQFAIKRSDYGMNFMQGGIGDEVTITFATEAVK